MYAVDGSVDEGSSPREAVDGWGDAEDGWGEAVDGWGEAVDGLTYHRRRSRETSTPPRGSRPCASSLEGCSHSRPPPRSPREAVDGWTGGRRKAVDGWAKRALAAVALAAAAAATAALVARSLFDRL